MRIKNLYKYLSTLLLILLLTICTQQVSADDDPAMGFSVAPTFSEKQIDPTLGYYYLQTKPDEVQKIEVKLSNQEEQSIKIKLSVEDAGTGANGGLSYGINGIENFVQDKTLVNPTSEIIKPDVEIIELKAKEEKVATFTVSPPKTNYEGIKLGQLVFQKYEEKSNGGLVDQYRYAISVILSESGDETDNGETLKLTGVKPTIKRGNRLVVANLQNPDPKRIVGLEVTAKITSNGKVVKEKKMSNFQFAPNSNVDLEMNWGLADIKAGDYIFSFEGKNSYKTFSFKKKFTITSKQATQINKDSAFKIKTPNWLKIMSVFDLIIVILISIVIFYRNKKWKILSKRVRSQKRRASKQSKNKKR